MRKKVLLQMLQEQEDKIKHLEECLNTQDNLLEEYHNREAMTVTALENAQNKAEEILETAENRAKNIVETAEHKRDALLSDAEVTVKGYREMLDRYNELLEKSAKQAQEGAELYASFVRAQSVTEEKLKDDNHAETTVQDIPDFEPEEESADPSQVMKNIYKLQDRDIPDFVDVPKKDEPEYTEEKQSRDVESILEEVLFKSQEEPKKEPEKVERVSDIIKDKKEEDVPLDDLLDEIISAGENNK